MKIPAVKSTKTFAKIKDYLTDLPLETLKNVNIDTFLHISMDFYFIKRSCNLVTPLKLFSRTFKAIKQYLNLPIKTRTLVCPFSVAHS